MLRRIELDRLRCPDCGGNTEATEVTPRLLRRERVDWRDWTARESGDRRSGLPRRGRHARPSDRTA